MQLKRLTHLTVVTTVIFFNEKISLDESIKVPYVSSSGFQAPLWLGEKAGAFRRNQLEVQLIYMPGGSLIVQTLLSGEVGIASLAPPSAISAWTKGADLVLVAGGIERALNVLMVSPRSKHRMILRANVWQSAVLDPYRISLCATRYDSTSCGRAKTWRSLRSADSGSAWLP